MKYDSILCMMVDDSVKTKDARYSTRNVTTSSIAFEEIKKMTGIIPETAQQKGDTMEFYHKGKKVAEWDMNNAEIKVFDQKTIDHAIRSCDSREDDIADELFDALQQIGKRNINKNEAEFISEKFFDGKVNADELMRIFNKYKKEYL